MQKLTLLSVLAMLCLKTIAQSPPIKSLTIGDTVPDIVLTNVYNYPDSTIRLSDLRGKLVILDFWSTWCGACIEAFPKMQELQNEFGEQIQVILVNTYEGDSIQKVKSFFEQRKQRTGQSVELPFSLTQISLQEYFPYKFVPHYIWINAHGEVMAATSQEEVNNINISLGISGNLRSLHTKKDILEFDKNTPLFKNGNGGNGSQIIYRSLFSKYVEGIGNAIGFNRDSTGKIIRLYMFNCPIPLIIQTAYRFQTKYPDNRIILELKDSSLFEKNISLYDKTFCYDLVVPPSSIDQIFRHLQDDIYRFFGIKGFTENRSTQCLILKSSPKLQKYFTKGGEEALEMDSLSLKRVFNNQPISVLVELLNSNPSFKNTPVINETDLKFKLDIPDPPLFQEMDFNTICNYLKNLGLITELSFRNIKMAVITDNF